MVSTKIVSTTPVFIWDNRKCYLRTKSENYNYVNDHVTLKTGLHWTRLKTEENKEIEKKKKVKRKNVNYKNI